MKTSICKDKWTCWDNRQLIAWGSINIKQETTILLLAIMLTQITTIIVLDMKLIGLGLIVSLPRHLPQKRLNWLLSILHLQIIMRRMRRMGSMVGEYFLHRLIGRLMLLMLFKELVWLLSHPFILIKSLNRNCKGQLLVKSLWKTWLQSLTKM